MDNFREFLEDQINLGKSLEENTINKDVLLFKKLRTKKVEEQWEEPGEVETEAPVKAPIKVPAPVKTPKKKPQSPIKPDPGVHPEPKG